MPKSCVTLIWLFNPSELQLLVKRSHLSEETAQVFSVVWYLSKDSERGRKGKGKGKEGTG